SCAAFTEDSADFPLRNQEIIGPLHGDVEGRDLFDRLGCGQCGDQRQPGEPFCQAFGWACCSENDGTVEISAGRRKPDSGETPAAGSLAIRNDDGPMLYFCLRKLSSLPVG